ncbi:MAG: peptidylprolyl isomerase [Nostocaceae cyanobacterium]|nr:peptidylprolyl isomerase [Nostocaceae cyanobacterium]
MTSLQVANHTLNSEEIIPLLASYRMIPQLMSESIIDQAIQPIDCTPEETAQALQEFDSHWGLTSEREREAWRKQYGLTQEQLEELATRRLKVEKFKQVTWGKEVNSYFERRKNFLAQVIYSLIRTEDKWLGNEIYFRIKDGEQSFAELAREYSEGPEAETGGMLGPVELGNVHPHLAQLLFTSPVGQIQPPVPLGEWRVIIRVEKFVPAKLDNAMRQRLLQENFQAWFQEQLQQLSPQEQIWMGVNS